MVQGIENDFFRKNYNAVKINITHPQVNTNGKEGENITSISTDNSVYNAVNINIDNPEINTIPNNKIYDYPEAKTYVPYNLYNAPAISVPEGFAAHYYETNVIIPQESNKALTENKSDDVAVNKAEAVAVAEEKNDTDKNEKAPEIVVPSPNFTSTAAEKGISTEVGKSNVKKPEIIPPENIVPKVDINDVVNNLSSNDYDTQAIQMEKIVKEVLDNEQNAIPYIVKDVFNSLTDITKQDTTTLATPNDKQIEARQKIMANAVAMNNKSEKLPYELNDSDIALATELSPMEKAERNKEYAMYTMAVLTKVYASEVEKHTGNVVPITDMPGISSMIDALRYSQNPSVKTAAIDALMYVQKPEYKNELAAIYSLAKTDSNPMVATAAEIALEKTNM